MKPQPTFESHLVIHATTLAPGAEWTPRLPGWTFMLIAQGVGYWIHPRLSQELVPGSLLVLSQRSPGYLRASQLGETHVQFFYLEPEKLTGLVTLPEQHSLRLAAAQEERSVRILPPGDCRSEKFRQLSAGTKGQDLSGRLQLLELFLAILDGELERAKPAAEPTTDAKARLKQLLREMPASELLELTFGGLAQRLRCTPRHLSRTFHEVVGMSFRDKQTEVRLLRAQELLTTTRSKVVEVALESGYQSLSLFNFMFKRRFGVSPGRWRTQQQQQKPRRCRTGRLAPV